MTQEAIEQREIPFSFDADPLTVAKNLKGATIISGGKKFSIIDARAFRGVDIKRKDFLDAKVKPIGTITGSPYRGRFTLPNITTADQGLVMPQEISEEINPGETKVITGPDRIARAMGIKPNESYQLSIEDPYLKILEIKESPQAI